MLGKIIWKNAHIHTHESTLQIKVIDDFEELRRLTNVCIFKYCVLVEEIIRFGHASFLKSIMDVK